MILQTINIGSQLEDPSAEIERTAWSKANSNFTAIANEVQNIDNTEKPVNLEISGWDMDTDTAKNVSYTLPANKRLASISATIQNDAKTVFTDFVYGGNLTYNKTNSRFEFSRTPSGIFDGTDYNDTTIIRGSLRFVLVPDIGV